MTALTGAILRKELAVWRRDPTVFVFLFAVPILLELLLERAAEALTHRPGADQTVPGLTTMFGFYILMFMGTAHYREHACGAWSVVRTSGLSRLMTAVAVAAPYFALSVTQMLCMLIAGSALFGGQLNGSPLALLGLVLATAWAAIGIGLVLLTLTRNLSAMQNLSQIVVLICGAVSGALLPLRLLPSWAQAVGHSTPQFWAVSGLVKVMSQRGGFGAALPSIAVLAAWGLVASLFVARYFDPGADRRVPIQ